MEADLVSWSADHFLCLLCVSVWCAGARRVQPVRPLLIDCFQNFYWWRWIGRSTSSMYTKNECNSCRNHWKKLWLGKVTTFRNFFYLLATSCTKPPRFARVGIHDYYSSVHYPAGPPNLSSFAFVVNVSLPFSIGPFPISIDRKLRPPLAAQFYHSNPVMLLR